MAIKRYVYVRVPSSGGWGPLHRHRVKLLGLHLRLASSGHRMDDRSRSGSCLDFLLARSYFMLFLSFYMLPFFLDLLLCLFLVLSLDRELERGIDYSDHAFSHRCK